MFSLLLIAIGLFFLAALVLLMYLAFYKLTGLRMPSFISSKNNISSQLKEDSNATAGTAPTAWFVDSLTIRALLIGLLALLMLIPLQLVRDIVDERGHRHSEVLEDIALTWGQQQTLLGPVLVIPFTEAMVIEENIIDKDGNAQTVKNTIRKLRTAQFLPTDLAIDVELANETRQRGIFRSLVYNADVQLDARFDPVQLQPLSDNIETIHWDKAWVTIGLSDTRAINEVSGFAWDGQTRTLSPGSRLDELRAGFHATLPMLDADSSYTLAMTMSTKGSGGFLFAPFGQVSKVTMHSDWPHPSFQGSALPNAHDITQAGFTAQWEIPHLARNYPQAWSSEFDQNLLEFTAGVSMFETVSLYSQATRAVKYGLLFIGLTFLTLFIFEIALARPLHAVQYALVGVALSVFFLVLLALSEHLEFQSAYVTAAALTIMMISLYTAAVMKNIRHGLGVFALLCALYAILYSLLQLEDYALLLGTALLVLVIAVLMMVTRNLHRREAVQGRIVNTG